VPAGEIAQRLVVSRDHLMKGLQALAALDLVRGERGRSGGFALGPACDQVRLGALVRELEPSMAMAECFEPDSTCPLTEGCGLAGVLARAQSAFLEELDQHTVSDLVAQTRTQLVPLVEGG